MNNVPILYIAIPVFFILYGIVITVMTKGKKGRVKKWLEQNPNAVKVYVNKTSMAAAVFSGQITVHSVDGEEPQFFYEKVSWGFYVTPGNHIIESSFSNTRPGILHKRVTTVLGPSKQEISADTGKTYNYVFDNKEKAYRFEVLS